ncbi:hypothetical protein ACFLQ7_02005 [Actinomycetota bacterium]
MLPTGETVTFGVHGGVAKHYGIDLDGINEHAATLDYVVAAVGSAMVGTFARMLRREGLVLSDGQLRAELVGAFRSEDGELALSTIEIRYQLACEPAVLDDEAVERAHVAHAPLCPLFKTFGECVAITSTWTRVA